MQTLIILCLVCWSLINPTTNLALVISIGLVIAIASATQDITVDALRIEQIGEHEGKSMQAGAAMAVVGWWTGYKLGGVVALNAAELFQKAGFENYWQITFLILCINPLYHCGSLFSVPIKFIILSILMWSNFSLYLLSIFSSLC